MHPVVRLQAHHHGGAGAVGAPTGAARQDHRDCPERGPDLHRHLPLREVPADSAAPARGSAVLRPALPHGSQVPAEVFRDGLRAKAGYDGPGEVLSGTRRGGEEEGGEGAEEAGQEVPEEEGCLFLGPREAGPASRGVRLQESAHPTATAGEVLEADPASIQRAAKSAEHAGEGGGFGRGELHTFGRHTGVPGQDARVQQAEGRVEEEPSPKVQSAVHQWALK